MSPDIPGTGTKHHGEKMTELFFLGTGAADYNWDHYGEPGVLGSTTTLLDGHILFDCGATAVKSILRYGVIPADITDIVLTHSHDDHYRPHLVTVLANQSRKHPLNFWGSPQACALVESPNCICHPLTDGTRFAIGKFQFTALPASHVLCNPKEEAFHYLVESPEGNLLYELDGAWMTSQEHQLIGKTHIDLAIWDATMSAPGDWRIFDHCDVSMIRTMRNALTQSGNMDSSSRVVFSHRGRTLWPENEAEQEVIAAREQAIIARDGMRISL